MDAQITAESSSCLLCIAIHGWSLVVITLNDKLCRKQPSEISNVWPALDKGQACDRQPACRHPVIQFPSLAAPMVSALFQQGYGLHKLSWHVFSIPFLKILCIRSSKRHNSRPLCVCFLTACFYLHVACCSVAIQKQMKVKTRFIFLSFIYLQVNLFLTLSVYIYARSLRTGHSVTAA